jgi:N-acetylmuramoyl-L-alanine amidase
MRNGRRIIHKSFAGASLGFALLATYAAARPAVAATANNAASKREAASSQFSRAQEMRAALNEKAPEKRSLADYKRVVATYERVHLITPHAAEVPDSLVAVGELNTEMGDRFGRSYYQAAADAYQFLIREYPASKYVPDVMLRVGQLEKDQLGDLAGATKTFQDFQKKFPHSSHKREVQETLAELALMRNAETGKLDPRASQPTPEPKTATPAVAPNREENLQQATRTSGDVSGGEQASSGGIPRIEHIRSSVTPDGAEVVIELEDSVQYVSGRIIDPDRIYFDLHAARLSPALARNKIRANGDLLTNIRVAQNQDGVVRVVLDVSGVKDYAATLMHKPPRLVIELYGSNGAHAPLQTAKAASPAPATKKPAEDRPAIPVTTETVSLNDPAPVASARSAVTEKGDGSPAPVVAKTTAPQPKMVITRPTKPGVAAKPDLVQPPVTPLPTRDGNATLTRTLGLKIGRIVIDAGHGGHDTGTIGPTGLMEKDLCLDVALRLGKLFEQKLPGADIVYTRSDDTFIPLEDRTRIANDAKADLFISIHANSSPDHGARGIETYYLNLKGSPEAMAVAARENSVSQQGIHDLEDMVKKIARTEKIDESKELAEDVQESLSKRIQRTARPVKNRGVRKAPFVVLIGADMPSILTEISFLSNPSDEQLLKKPEHRQRVAEGLYTGVSEYLQSLNSMAVNRGSKPARPAPVATVEQSRNQQ